MNTDKYELVDFNKIIIDKNQLRMLKMFKIKEKINIYQFHGYFRFPNFTNLLIAMQDLEKLNLVYKEDFHSPNDYLITQNGERYLLFLKRNRSMRIGINTSVLAAISTVLGFLLSLLRN